MIGKILIDERRACKPMSIREVLESMAEHGDGIFGVINQIIIHKSTI